MSDYVILNRLGEKLGLDHSNIRQYALKNGFTPLKIRVREAGNVLCLALTQDDANRLTEIRESQGFSVGNEPVVVSNDNGYFYIVQLIPEYNPNRVKLGFATDVNARLQAHRTSAPTAKLVKSWVCKRVWETAAIASTTRIDSTGITDEVYECTNLDELIQRAQGFFSIMPSTV